MTIERTIALLSLQAQVAAYKFAQGCPTQFTYSMLHLAMIEHVMDIVLPLECEPVGGERWDNRRNV